MQTPEDSLVQIDNSIEWYTKTPPFMEVLDEWDNELSLLIADDSLSEELRYKRIEQIQFYSSILKKHISELNSSMSSTLESRLVVLRQIQDMCDILYDFRYVPMIMALKQLSSKEIEEFPQKVKAIIYPYLQDGNASIEKDYFAISKSELSSISMFALYACAKKGLITDKDYNSPFMRLHHYFFIGQRIPKAYGPI